MLNYFQKLYAEGPEAFYQIVQQNLAAQKRMFIVTANPETFTYGEKLKNFQDLLLDERTTLIPDGIGIVKAAQMLDFNIQERITGIDLVVKLLEIGNQNKYKLCLLGAQEEVITKLKEVLKEKYPHLELGTIVNGYVENKDEVFAKMAQEKPDICLVALGIPAQEELIYKHLAKFKKGILVGVGGSFDVISGTKKRAPKIFQKLNLEWLYRLLKEPKRIKRFYNNNVKFIGQIRKLRKKK